MLRKGLIGEKELLPQLYEQLLQMAHLISGNTMKRLTGC